MGCFGAAPCLRMHRGKRRVFGKRHGRCDRREAKALTEEWNHHGPLLDNRQSRRNGSGIQFDIGTGGGMSLGVPSQEPDVIGNHHRRFGRQKTCPVILRVLYPVASAFTGTRIARHVVDQHQHMLMINNGGSGRRHGIPQISHDRVDTRCERLDLPCFQFFGEMIDIRIAPRFMQHCLRGKRPYTDHRGIAKIPEGLQVIAARLHVRRDRRAGLVDQPVPQRI